jgi:LmbE family N-acetylglucosaminyl deacetylase
MMNKKGTQANEIVMVVAAHPDDEVLGCGGTLARHAENGDKVHVLILADGETSRQQAGEVSERWACADRAANILGIRLHKILGFPDNQLDKIALLEVVREIELAISQLKPTVVYTHHGGDLNIDHQIACRAVMTACRPLPGSTVNAIYTFETVSSTEWGVPQLDPMFMPVRVVDISDTMQKKMAALQCYDAEMRPFPHARSYEAIEHLARLRGTQSGIKAAEVFGVMRQIWS